MGSKINVVQRALRLECIDRALQVNDAVTRTGQGSMDGTQIVAMAEVFETHVTKGES